MIVVTVGSTYFDELIQAVDLHASLGLFGEEEVVCQIGQGAYIPKYTDHFRYSKDIELYFKNASFVITHGGATVLQLYKNKIPFVAVPNIKLSDNHQSSFLTYLSSNLGILVANNMEELPDCYLKVYELSFGDSERRSDFFDFLAG